MSERAKQIGMDELLEKARAGELDDGYILRSVASVTGRLADAVAADTELPEEFRTVFSETLGKLRDIVAVEALRVRARVDAESEGDDS